MCYLILFGGGTRKIDKIKRIEYQGIREIYGKYYVLNAMGSQVGAKKMRSVRVDALQIQRAVFISAGSDKLQKI